MAPETALVEVEVAYATSARQLIVRLQLPAGSTVAQAIEASAIRAKFPQIEAEPIVGIFSRKVTLDQPLSAGDRVEIYRPLVADPKEIRRQRAREQAKEQKAGRQKPSRFDEA